MSEEKQLTPQQKFEEKLQDRIRNDIGELVPDEVLAELIARSIDNMFFKERKINQGSGYYGRVEYVPARFEQFVQEAMEPMLRDAAEDWVTDNSDSVKDALEKILRNNADSVVLETLQRIMAQPINIAFDHYNQRLTELEQRST
jgi:CO dehydrogenase/acetyl-CoA synthase beta subunit